MAPLNQETLKRFPRTEQLQAWVAAEHARLHLVMGWPASVRRDTLLRAVRSSIEMLTIDPDAVTFECLICKSGEPSNVLQFSHRPEPIRGLQDVAA